MNLQLTRRREKKKLDNLPAYPVRETGRGRDSSRAFASWKNYLALAQAIISKARRRGDEGAVRAVVPQAFDDIVLAAGLDGA